MTIRRIQRLVIQGIIAAAALALAACDQEPYPNPTPEPPPPPPPAADLAGAPIPPPPPPPPRSSAPVIIAMAPIPNPPEHPVHRRVYRVYHGRKVTTAPGYHPLYRYVAPVKPRVAAAAHTVGHAVAKAAAPVRHAAAVAAAKVAPKPVAKPGVVAKAVAPAAKVAAAPKPAAGAAAPKPAVAAAANATAPATAENAQGSTPLGDRATRLAALETSLADAIRKGAELKAPSAFTAGKATDVTLTIPADFSETVRDEAGKNDLTDAAASVNLTAVLSGDGFAVTPDTAQSQPLTPGQPTEFHWTVTAQEGAKGPLHADVGADLLGAGSDVLNLGSVQAGDNFGFGMLKSNRMLGIGILLVLAVLVLAWLARGRSGPSRSASARREARRARSGQPVVLGGDEI